MTDQGKQVYGIDLGTTYSCIARMEYGRPTVIPNTAGDRTTPSVVQFADTDRIVGKEAKNSAPMYPGSTVTTIKRHMGNASYTFPYEGVNYTPEEISSYILRKLVQDAEQYTGETITDVVITCPAYFGIPERDATTKAGEIAGLNVRSIINEPTAAAIAYGLNEQSDQVILVYDLGGGTFDVTVIEIKSGEITVLCTDGDNSLGGADWDAAVASYLSEEWQRQIGTTEDPMDSYETLEDLLLKSEAAKQALTQRKQTDVAVIHDSQKARVTLTREKFDELTLSLLERTISLTQQALAEAKKPVDQILLVGGSTKMPQVAARLTQEFGQEPRMFDPDESVAKGAAIYGQKLMLDQEIKIHIAKKTGQAAEDVDISSVSPKVLDEAQRTVADDMNLTLGAVKKLVETDVTNVVSKSFGLVVWSRRKNQEIIKNLILRNAKLPAADTQQFGTMEAGQDSVLIRLMENMEKENEENGNEVDDLSLGSEIGQVELELLPGMVAGSPIEITFQLSREQRLRVYAKDVVGGHEKELIVQIESGTSDEDVASAKARSKHLTMS